MVVYNITVDCMHVDIWVFAMIQCRPQEGPVNWPTKAFAKQSEGKLGDSSYRTLCFTKATLWCVVENQARWLRTSSSSLALSQRLPTMKRFVSSPPYWPCSRGRMLLTRMHCNLAMRLPASRRLHYYHTQKRFKPLPFQCFFRRPTTTAFPAC